MRLAAMVEALGQQAESFFPGLEQGLRIALGTCVESLASDELRHAIQSVDTIQHVLEALKATLVAEDDHRSRQRNDSLDPAGSTALWLREHLHLTSSAAYARVRTSRTLEELPATRSALARAPPAHTR
jgi:hypothetical protein